MIDEHHPAMDVLTSDADFVIQLPYPPSVNRIWRSAPTAAGKHVHVAPAYRKWKDEASAALMMKRGWMMHRITGTFSVSIGLCAPKGHPRGDLDNRIKAVLDFLQFSTIISNDKHCQLICAYWSPGGPEGAAVRVKPWGPQNHQLSVERILERFAETAEAIRA